MDFKLYTNALKAYTSDNGDMYVTGTTSSTIRDLHGDEMTTDALKSMADTAKQNMTIWLNHNYNVPEDLFGSVTDARIVKRFDEASGEEVYDLDIDIKVCPEDENPEALRTYKAIKRGVRLGLSIGARIEQASKKKDKNTSVETYVIERIRLLESSVVGIPANQRSYLQNAVKSLRARGAQIREIEDAVKAVEVEGEPSAEKGALIDNLNDLLSNTIAFYLKAHGSHWNVVGEDFNEYHDLFGEIYEDVQSAIDPLAEQIRKLNGNTPADIRAFAAQAAQSVAADDADPESLAEALYASNEALLEKIVASINEANTINQQGILNFLAERQDAHQKWSWQLRASLAPEESESEPAETPETPEQTEPQDVGVEKQKEDVPMDTTENAAVEAVEEALPPVPPSEVPAEAAVEAPVEETVVAEEVVEKALPVTDRCNSVMAELEAIHAEEPNAELQQCLKNAHGWVKHYTELAAAPAPEEEAPTAPGETPAESEGDESKPAFGKSAVDVADLAKSALDAAEAVRAEVETLKSALTVATAEKAKVEADFEKAVALLEKAVAVPVGRKSGYQPSSKTASKAVWLEPFVQRLLDSHEE